MQLTSTTFAPDSRIPERCAFGIPDAEEHLKLGENMNPQISWSDVPDGARSLVLLCIDRDVPASLENFNQEGKTIAADEPRTDFVHWAIVDIPATDGALKEGECSDGIVPGGKDQPQGPAGSRQGLNDYTNFFAGDPDMEGDYHGYDGPCPPWNDERIHHYRFMLFAVDIDRAPIEDRFTAADVLAAIEPHVIERAVLTGTYTLNPDLL